MLESDDSIELEGLTLGDGHPELEERIILGPDNPSGDG